MFFFLLFSFKKLPLIYIDFQPSQTISHPKFFSEHWEDNIGSFFSFFPFFISVSSLPFYLSFLLPSSQMIYNTLKDFPDGRGPIWMISCLSWAWKERRFWAWTLPSRKTVAPISTECPTYPSVSRLESGGEVENRGDQKVVENGSKPVIDFFSKLH